MRAATPILAVVTILAFGTGPASAAPADDSGTGLPIALALMVALPGYLALQYLALRRFRGAWWLFAAVPLLPMGPILAVTVFAFLGNAGLWPLVVIFTAPLALAYLALLFGARFVSRRA